MEDNKLPIDELDTEETLLYKYSYAHQVPSKYINLIPPPKKLYYKDEKIPNIKDILNSYNYENIIINILNDINILTDINNITLNEIHDKYNHYISFNDIINIFYLSTKKGLSVNKEAYTIISDSIKDKYYLLDIYNYLIELNLKSEFSTILDIYYNNLGYANISINDIIIENIIRNYYIYIGNTEKIISISDIKDDYKSWIVKYKNSLEYIYNKLDRIEIIHKTLYDSMEKHSHIVISEVKYIKITRSGTPQLILYDNTTRDVDITDGIDIFNISTTSYNVPYIQYNDDTKNYYKLFKGDVADYIPDYTNIIQSSSDTKTPNTLYMTVWSELNIPKKRQNESYMNIIYNIEENNIIIKSPIIEYNKPNGTILADEIILNNIRDSVRLNIIYDGEINVSGIFNIYGMNIEYISFVYNMLINDVLSTYLYVDESNKAFSFKQRLYFHFRSIIDIDSGDIDNENNNISSAWISMKQKYTKIDEDIMDNNGILTKINSNTPYIKVNILRAASRSVVKQLQFLIPRLISYHTLVKPIIINSLNYIDTTINVDGTYNIPYISTYLDELEQKGSNNIDIIDSKLTGIDLLKLQAPDLIVNGYARKCGDSNKKPMIISAEEVQQLSEKNFIMIGNTEFRGQVLPFPPDSPKWYFICTKDGFKFPGLMVNNLPNSNIYPFIPCCYTKDKMSENVNSWYNQVYRGKQKVRVTTSVAGGHVFITGKLLERGRIGQLPIMISTLLQFDNTNNDPNIIYNRFGVLHTPNSFLHSVLEAIRDPIYLSIPDDYSRIEYVRSWRNTLVDYIRQVPSLLKQELYDFDDNEIIDQISKLDTFFDPSLYYRLIEEMLNINIYVFNTPKTSDKMKFGKIEMPRYKYFHSRPLRINRSSIIIFKHWGTDPDKLTYPQCEYIIKNNKISQQYISLFNINMTNLLHDAMMKTNESITWSIDPRNHRPTARSNIFSSFNILEILQSYINNIYGQYIDSYGKSRGYVLKLNDEYVSIYTPPSQPEKYIQITQSIPEENTSSLITVLSIFNINPNMITIEDNYITGLWFPILDIENGIYCTIKKIDLSTFDENISEEFKYIKSLSIGPKYNLFVDGRNEVKRIKLLQRNLKIILQLVKWLYILSKFPIDAFINKYITVSRESYIGIDSSKIYNFNNIYRVLPNYIDIDHALNYLISMNTNLIQNGKITGYSQKFTDGIIYFIKEYDKTTKGLIRIPLQELNDIYVDEYDFKYQDNTAIFLNESDMKIWIYSSVYTNIDVTHIKHTLNIKYNLFRKPYMYKDKNENIYMIQNVLDGSFDRAINIAHEWHINMLNPGYTSDLYNEIDESNNKIYPAFIIYGISTDGLKIQILDKSNGNLNHIKILNYNPNILIDENLDNNISQFAAILPML